MIVACGSDPQASEAEIEPFTPVDVDTTIGAVAQTDTRTAAGGADTTP